MEELQVAAATIEVRGTLREKAAEVETARMLCVREEEEGGCEEGGKEKEMTLRRKKLSAFLDREREGTRGETERDGGGGGGGRLVSHPRECFLILSYFMCFLKPHEQGISAKIRYKN